jgi:mannose-6-phosphate isomerase
LIRKEPLVLLGQRCFDLYGADLPFLMKVLSINSEYGLSVQAHPDKARAIRLNAERPDLYPDPNHKPEIGIALTPVTLLYGFRPIDEIRRIFLTSPELQPVLSKHTRESLLSERASTAAEKRATLEALYTELLTAPENLVAPAISTLSSRLESSKDSSPEARWLSSLRSRYGDHDAGLLALFVMNIIRLEPGKAIFIAPNVPHAYLDGDLVECMACSDNVVRAGLTSKYKDIPTLLDMVDYDSSVPALIVPAASDNGFLVFPTPASEFEVSMLPVGSSAFEMPVSDAPQILLCLGERCSVRSGSKDGAVNVGSGGAVYFPPGSKGYEVERANAALYRVTLNGE